ncbi:hypothetical protein NXV86_27560 [Bacteroides sp. BFG-257]|uniref:hypothetical protein n=1 Tax=Bacteroides TaxID=816 RepID=UPI001CCC5D86|nr:MULTISPECIES: hypothetical protein [Bacteroides]UBD69840.1 hypothetical protein K6V21_26425 [Bacteroides cellulosilyticus]UVO98480.1 hypothetical protein NXV86_27560 [Bacteroides sp. BFG-257]
MEFLANTLEEIIDGFSNEYIRHNGVEKFKKVYDKVSNSNKLAELDGRSLRLRLAPTAHDFLTALHTIPYFIFSSQYTCALGALFAIKLWDEKVNRRYQLNSSLELRNKAIAVLEILKL